MKRQLALGGRRRGFFLRPRQECGRLRSGWCGRRLRLEALEDRRLLSAVAFPVPFQAEEPLGGLIYHSSAEGTIAAAAETDQFTVELDDGQTATVVVDPEATLRPTIELRDPAGQSIGAGLAGSAGQDAVLQVVPTAGAGTYTVEVGGASESTGGYTVRLILNAAVEGEQHDGPANNDPPSAQDLGAAFLALGDGLAQRGAMLGTLASSDDWYRFALDDGQSASLVLAAGTRPGAILELYDALANRLAMAAGTFNTDPVIDDFIDSTSDGGQSVYFARVMGPAATDYGLVITRDAGFDVEPNGRPGMAQDLAGTGAVLGHLGRPSPAPSDDGQAAAHDPERVDRVERVGRVEERGPAGHQVDQAGNQADQAGHQVDQAGPRCSTRPTYAAGRLIVCFAEGVTDSGRAKALAAVGGKMVRALPLIDGAVVELSDRKADVPAAAAGWSAHPAIRYAEPDYLVHALDTLPDDPSFSELWNMHNTGQTGGTPDADVDAPQAWDLFTGSTSVVVASIDCGVDYTHEDLAANMWTNPGEIPGDGRDNDGNGYVDDVYGIDPCNDDSDPWDDAGHGTHTSGTIGAVGNNGVGVAGVNWNVQIMALKFLNNTGSGTTSDAIACLDYMTMMKTGYGVNLVASNNSWGGGEFSQALKDAIRASNEAGILFVAAAGNDAMDTDGWAYYPCGFDLEGIISVAASDHDDQLASFSNYGATTVDLAAPGVNVLSSLPENTYGVYSGTSMSAPHVAGAVALLAAYKPTAKPLELKDAILTGVDPLPQFAGITLSGGRLNLAGAMQVLDDPSDCYRVAVRQGDSLRIETSTPGDGEYQFANPLDPAVELYDPAGSLVAADDNSAPDGHNALLTHPAETTGAYTVRVMAEVSRGGDYLLQVAGPTGTLPPFAVAGTNPAHGAAVQNTGPVQITLDFNDAVLLSSLEASDLTVGGVPAAAVSAANGNRLTFEFPAGLNPGANQVAMAAGAVVDLQGTPVEPFSSTLCVFEGSIVVSSLGDEIDGDYSPGELTLREALALAAEMPGRDVIRFDGSLHGGTIMRAPRPAWPSYLHVDSDVDIEGPGPELLTVDANENDNVFCVPPGVEATISGLTITGGSAEEYSYIEGGGGAGICNLGTLTVTDTTICGNRTDGSGDGIYSAGHLTVTDSTFFDNDGAGIANWGGTLAVTGATMSDAVSVWLGDVTVADTAICGGPGCGLWIGLGTVTVTNTTISGNSHGGVYICGNATVTFINTTITGNSSDYRCGGVALHYVTDEIVTLDNTIVAGNSVTDGSTSSDVYGQFNWASSHNLIGVIDGSWNLNGTGTIYGTAAAPLDPLLGPLGDHGGPTLTHAPLGGSPAIDAGSNERAMAAGLTCDQRGAERFFDGTGDGTVTVDLGAYEFGATVPAEVVGRHVFYNHSAFDGNDAEANDQDDGAIGRDKVALLPGQTAGFSNYTSYTRGLNGIMVDVAELAGTPTVDDFQFKVGNDDDPSGWTAVSATPQITVRPGDGVNGSDRVTIIWPDNVIQKQWLQVRVLATANTGLEEDDVFYFGNAIGESGNSAADAKVNAYDMLGARDNQRTFMNPAPVDFAYDFNRDARVNAYDLLIARDNQTHFLDALKLITAPGGKASEAGMSVLSETRATRWDWLYEFDRIVADDRPAEATGPAEATLDRLLATMGR